MARRSRVVLPGVPHHITQRGNNREAVFFSDADRRAYLKILQENATEYGMRVLAWCLMTNHVHLIAVPDNEKSLARTLGRTHSEYAQEVNRDERRVGHLWQHRFYSCALDGAHLMRAIRYVELNPVRAGLAGGACDWPWSSAAAHVHPGIEDSLLDPEWRDWCRGWDYEGWKEWLDTGVPSGDLEMLRRATLTGEPFGRAAFVDDLERQTGRQLRVRRQGRPRKDEKPV